MQQIYVEVSQKNEICDISIFLRIVFRLSFNKIKKKLIRAQNQ